MRIIANYSFLEVFKRWGKELLFLFIVVILFYLAIYYNYRHMGIESWKVPIMFCISSFLIILSIVWFPNKRSTNLNRIDLLCLGYIIFLILRNLISKDSNNLEPVYYVKWFLLICIYLISRNIPSIYTKHLIIAISTAGLASWLLSLFANSGHAAAYLSICFAGLLAFVLSKKILIKYSLYYVLLALLLLGLIITFSRGAILAVLIALIFLTYNCLKNRPLIKGKTVFFLVLIPTVCIFLSFVLYRVRPESADVRLLLWRVCGENFLHKPFFGYSPESLQSLYMYWQADYFQQHPDSFFVPFATNHYQSFNEIIHILCEQGIVGFLIIAYITGYVLIKRNRKEYLPIKASLIALIVVSCFLYTFDILPIAILLPLFIGLLNNTADTDGRKVIFIESKNGKKVKILTKCLLSALCISVIFYSSLIFFKYDKVQKKIMNYIHEDSGIALTNEDDNIIFRNRDMALAYAGYSYQEKDTSKRIEILKRSSKKIPISSMFLIIGDLYLQIEDFKEAENCYLLAYHMVPDRMLPKYYLFNYYKQIKDSAKAKEWAIIIMNSNPRIYNAVTIDIKHYAIEYLHN